MKTPEERFWTKVDRSGGDDACWPWKASLDTHGYGHIWWKGRLATSPRVALELSLGRPLGKSWALHNCPGGDNPKCCNPAHLFVGDVRDNVADMIAKGRWRPAKGDDHYSRRHPERLARGERVNTARLTVSDVVAIRKSRESGPALSRRYGVTRQTINRIKSGHSWTHVPVEGEA